MQRTRNKVFGWIVVGILVLIGIGGPGVPMLAAALTWNELNTRVDGDDNPSWSPDAKWYVFSSEDDSKNFDLYVDNVDVSGRRNITATAEIDEVEPQWSPDGSRIAFLSQSYSGTDIHTINSDGTDRRNLTGLPASYLDLKWSPDGTRLAFSSNRDFEREEWLPESGVDPDVRYPINFNRPELYVMDVESGELTRLTFNEAFDGSPTWSPDGTQIAFQSKRDGDSEIFVINVDGTGERRLTFNDRADIDPVWSPDGSHIAFSSNRFQTDVDEAFGLQLFDIYTMKADGSDQFNLSNRIDSNDTGPQWLPDGKYLVYDSQMAGAYGGYEGNSDIWVLQVGETHTNKLPLTNNNRAFEPDRFTTPRWSPDGRSIMYVTRNDGEGRVTVTRLNNDGETEATGEGDQ